MSAQPSAERYVPALGLGFLTGLYDRVIATTLPERALKGRLVDEALAGAPAAPRVLDLGCGTGTLLLLLAGRAPHGLLAGLDGDPRMLAVARAKHAATGVAPRLCQALSWDAPFAPGSFDRVVSSLFFHHLTPDGKRRTLARAFELLRPGGELHLLDWGQARGLLMRLAYVPVQVFDGFDTTTDNVLGRLPGLMEEAGFRDVSEVARRDTLFGTISLYRARRPEC